MTEWKSRVWCFGPSGLSGIECELVSGEYWGAVLPDYDPMTSEPPFRGLAQKKVIPLGSSLSNCVSLVHPKSLHTNANGTMLCLQVGSP